MPDNLIIPPLPIETMPKMGRHQLLVLLEEKIDLLLAYAYLKSRDRNDYLMIMQQINVIEMELNTTPDNS